MKRSWIGLGLLVGLLAASLLTSSAMARICREDSGKLDQAVQAADRMKKNLARYIQIL